MPAQAGIQKVVASQDIPGPRLCGDDEGCN